MYFPRARASRTSRERIMPKHVILFASLLLLTASANCQTLPADLPYDVAPWPKEGHHPQPEFPLLVALAGIQGKVIARMEVDSLGRVVSTMIIKESPSLLGLGEAVTGALQCWEFDPARKHSVPVASTIEMTFFFLPRYANSGDTSLILNKEMTFIALSDSTVHGHLENKTITYQPPPVILIRPSIKRDRPFSP